MWREWCAERKLRECEVPESCGRDARPSPGQGDGVGVLSLTGAGAEPAPQEPARATPPKTQPPAPGAEPLGGTCLSRCRHGPRPGAQPLPGVRSQLQARSSARRTSFLHRHT